MTEINFDDTPILIPDQDKFGIDPFAQAVASSIKGMKCPEGTTIAINGAWGSGKSSAVNLVLHHLEQDKSVLEGVAQDTVSQEEKAADVEVLDEIKIIRFACWWFRGEEALALAFLQELNAALKPKLGEKSKKLVSQLGQRLLKSDFLIKTGVNVVTAGLGGDLVGKASELLGDMIDSENSVEAIFEQLSTSLEEQSNRYLVVIDDIDRLAPDEALLIFRLVKSIGRLPKVMYLLAYDRELAEKMVAERYPSEGPHYLEKIVQAPFELPLPDRIDLYNAFLSQVEGIIGPLPEEETHRFMNVFYDLIAPLLKWPRDIALIINALSVTWPAVKDEVNEADFLAVEALRCLRPSVYRAIRENKDILAGRSPETSLSHPTNDEELLQDNVIKKAGEEFWSPLKDGIERLFPRLESIGYGAEFEEAWERDKLICSKLHFDTYFRFSIGPDVLPKRALDELIERSGDADFVVARLAEAVVRPRKNGGTMAAVVLEEITRHSEDIPEKNIPALISALFSVADDLDVKADESGAFSLGNNRLRIHWLLNRLVTDRIALEERSSLFKEACQTAQLVWLMDFVRRCRDEHLPPKEGKSPKAEEQKLVNSETAGELVSLAIQRIKAASESDDLEVSGKLVALLYSWLDFLGENDTAVKNWTSGKLQSDAFVIKLAEGLTGTTYSQSMGDRVARTSHSVSKDGLDEIVDINALLERVQELRESSSIQDVDKAKLEAFWAAWNSKER